MKLDPIPDARFAFQGVAGHYLAAVTEQWLLVAPKSNPAMLEMFRDRDSPPLRDLLPWSGEFAGKYLTAASQVYAAARDQRLFAWLEEFVRLLVSFQDPDGYLGPWPRGSRLTGRAPNCKGGTWDAWGHYHLIVGLLSWSRFSEGGEAREAAIRIGDLLCDRFLGSGKPRLVDTGSTEMNLAPAHALCLLHRETASRRYLDLALQVVGEFSARDPDGNPLAGDWLEQALAGREFWQMPKPRWESLHPIQALAELSRITGEERYGRAVRHLWRSMRDGDRHNNGGFTSGEKATGDPFNSEPIETCCTIAWMVLTADLLKLTGDPTVADELELSLFNSALGMHSATGRWATYNTPMNGFRRASAHTIVFQCRDGSPELNCCSVNAPRGLGLLSEWALMSDAGGLVLNHYGPAAYVVPRSDGSTLRLSVDTSYPVNGRVAIALEPEREQDLCLELRVPAWSRDTRISVNGAGIGAVKPASYVAIRRRWRPGDAIVIDFDFSLRYGRGGGKYEGLSSMYRGPLLLAFDHRYNLDRSSGDTAKVHSAEDRTMQNDPMLEVPALGAKALAPRETAWDGWLPPLLLLECDAVDGRPVRLCDFASAGAAGTPYVSWLPVVT